MRQKIDRFTRRLSGQELVLGCLILLPLFFYCNSYIGSAIVKWTILTFNLSITSTNANIWLNFVVDLITALIAVIILRKFIMRQWKDFMNNKLSIIVAGCLQIFYCLAMEKKMTFVWNTYILWYFIFMIGILLLVLLFPICKLLRHLVPAKEVRN